MTTNEINNTNNAPASECRLATAAPAGGAEPSGIYVARTDEEETQAAAKEETQAAAKEDPKWSQTINDMFRKAYYHVWCSTWFLAVVVYLVSFTINCQMIYRSPITLFLHSLAGCCDDTNHHHMHDSPPPEEFTSHPPPMMSTWFRSISDKMSSLVSNLFAPTATITKICAAFCLPDVANVHAWLRQILGCTGMGLIYAVGYLVSAIIVTWLVRRLPVIRDFIYPLYGLLVPVAMNHYFHDDKTLPLFFAVVGIYGSAITTFLYARHCQAFSILKAQETAGQIPSTTEIEQCGDVAAFIRTFLTMQEAIVGIAAFAWIVESVFHGR
jgi:hypothetical protein